MRKLIIMLIPILAISGTIYSDYREDQMARDRAMMEYNRSLYWRAGAGYNQYGYPSYPGYPGYVVPYPYYNPTSNPTGFDYDTDAIYHRNLNK